MEKRTKASKIKDRSTEPEPTVLSQGEVVALGTGSTDKYGVRITSLG